MAVNSIRGRAFVGPVLCAIVSLLFYSSLAQEKDFQIKWDMQRPVGLVIPIDLVDSGDVKVRLESYSEHVIGNIERHGSRAIFKPLIPFQLGSTYVLYSGDRKIYKVTVPISTSTGKARVTGVFPSCDTVPENLLKIYVEFSTSMGHSTVYDHLVVRDNMGHVLDNVFLELQPELWNQDRTLLTLWLDPGRIKRELTPNKLSGQPLKSGLEYTVQIKPQFKDARGNNLDQGWSWTFFADPADRQKPSIDQWTLSVPGVKTLQPLVLQFPEPMDYGLLQEAISIYKTKQIIGGRTAVFEDQKGWSFIPNEPWQPGTYSIEVLSILEDLAGNNLNRLFDVDLTKVDTVESREVREIEFVVR